MTEAIVGKSLRKVEHRLAIGRHHSHYLTVKKSQSPPMRLPSKYVRLDFPVHHKSVLTEKRPSLSLGCLLAFVAISHTNRDTAIRRDTAVSGLPDSLAQRFPVMDKFAYYPTVVGPVISCRSCKNDMPVQRIRLLKRDLRLKSIKIYNRKNHIINTIGEGVRNSKR